MVFAFPQLLPDLITAYRAHLSKSAREALRALPPGWLAPVHSMLDRVEQVLSEKEQRTFRWTGFSRKNGNLLAKWSGADESVTLIDQIVEEAHEEAANCCIECGTPTLLKAQEPEGPRCLFHAALKSGRDKAKAWELAALEMVQNLRGESAGMATINPKAVAAALPLLIKEAAAYFRAPDQDVRALTGPLREALQKLEQELHALDGRKLASDR